MPKMQTPTPLRRISIGCEKKLKNIFLTKTLLKIIKVVISYEKKIKLQSIFLQPNIERELLNQKKAKVVLKKKKIN